MNTAGKLGMHGRLSWKVRRGGRMGRLERVIHRLRTAGYYVQHGGLVLTSELRAIQTVALTGQRIDHGVVCRKAVTDVFAEQLVDTLQASEPANFEAFRFHAMGTGAGAEAAGDTALVTEVDSRNSGTQTENGSKVYRSVGTTTAGAARAIIEHGIFDQLAAGGNLLDRSVIGVINLGTSDTIQWTYDLTVTSGG